VTPDSLPPAAANSLGPSSALVTFSDAITPEEAFPSGEALGSRAVFGSEAALGTSGTRRPAAASFLAIPSTALFGLGVLGFG